MTDAPKLKPCPWCGGEARLVVGEECAQVQCTEAKWHRGPFADGDNDAEYEAIAAWNTRAPDPDLEAHIGAVLEEAAALMFDDLWITADNDREEGYDEGLSAANAAILALNPTALTALDRKLREARVEGMRKAVKCVFYREDEERIRALIAAEERASGKGE